MTEPTGGWTTPPPDPSDPYRRTPGVPADARVPGWQPPPLARPRDSVFVLARSGRLPTWYLLPKGDRARFEREHVDLMLDVADRHNMRRLEGYKLITQQQPWVRYWVMEFPDLAGAEAWIEAEMAPPYGLYGRHEYHLARAHAPDHFDDWVPAPPPPIVPWDGDPRRDPVPAIDVSRDSIVVLLFGRGQPGYEAVPHDVRDDEGHIWLMKDVARRPRPAADRGLRAHRSRARVPPRVGHRMAGPCRAEPGSRTRPCRRTGLCPESVPARAPLGARVLRRLDQAREPIAVAVAAARGGGPTSSARASRRRAGSPAARVPRRSDRTRTSGSPAA